MIFDQQNAAAHQVRPRICTKNQLTIWQVTQLPRYQLGHFTHAQRPGTAELRAWGPFFFERLSPGLIMGDMTILVCI